MENKSLEYAKASLAMEGLHLDQKQGELLKKKIAGEISHADFVKEALRLANE